MNKIYKSSLYKTLKIEFELENIDKDIFRNDYINFEELEKILNEYNARKLDIKMPNTNDVFESIITSNLSDASTFYIQISNKDTERLINEISNYIRYKRVTDSQWLTFDELKIEQRVHRKCFCFNLNNRKWMRAKIEKFSQNANECDIRYFDSGYKEFRVSFNTIIAWKDFKLNDKYNFRSFRCKFQDEKNNAIFNIQQSIRLNRIFQIQLKEYMETNDLWLIGIHNEESSLGLSLF